MSEIPVVHLPIPSLEELATQYAMLARDDYDSQTFAGDGVEHERIRLKQQMAVWYGEYRTEQAIKNAFEILEMMNFHPEGNNS
jgi:hypothetical protein